MRKELLKKVDRVRALKGWRDSHLSQTFGVRRAVECLRKEPPTIQLGTAERLSKWLDQIISDCERDGAGKRKA